MSKPEGQANVTGTEPAGSATRGSLTRVAVDGLEPTRRDPADLYGSSCDTVEPDGGKLDFVNLRGSELTRRNGPESARGLATDEGQPGRFAPILAARPGSRVTGLAETGRHLR